MNDYVYFEVTVPGYVFPDYSYDDKDTEPLELKMGVLYRIRPETLSRHGLRSIKMISNVDYLVRLRDETPITLEDA